MSSVSPRIAVIIVAAGSGTRAGGAGALPKQYQSLAGKPVLRLTLERFAASPLVSTIVTVINPAHTIDYAAASQDIPRLAPRVAGGATRQASVLAGLEALAKEAPDFVLIHDAARPFVTEAVIARVVARLATAPAVLAALPLADTLKRTDGDNRITDTIPRERLWTAQTPQGFDFASILAAHRRAAAAGRQDFTDDAAVAEWAGLPVVTVTGDAANTKITTSDDLTAAERKVLMDQMYLLGDIRVGTGYDVHAFEPGDHVTLCGVRIPHTHRLNGHSDADVALHALTDAILGALGDGDIGSHFPPSEEKWRGCDSAVFVRHAMDLLARRGGVLAHADIALVAESPKIGPHREAMRARVAEILGVSITRVGIKATTNEKMGFVGRKEGLAAIATATIRLPFGGADA